MSTLKELTGTYSPGKPMLLTTSHNNQDNGMIILYTSFASLPLDKGARVMTSFTKGHKTTELALQSGYYVIHCLDQSQLDYVSRFGMQSGHTVDKFADIKSSVTRSKHNQPIVSGVCSWLECKFLDKIEFPDVYVVVSEIVDYGVSSGSVLTLESMNLNLAPEIKEERERQFERDLQSHQKLVSESLSSEEKPQVSEEKPQVSEEKPQLSEEKSQVSEEKPQVSEEKPQVSEEKPQVSEYRGRNYTETRVQFTCKRQFSAMHAVTVPEWSDEKNFQTYGKDAFNHGHDFYFKVKVIGTPDPLTGMVIWNTKLEDCVEEVVKTVHYENLYGHPIMKGRVPTVEMVAISFYEAIQEKLAKLSDDLKLYKKLELHTLKFGEFISGSQAIICASDQIHQTHKPSVGWTPWSDSVSSTENEQKEEEPREEELRNPNHPPRNGSRAPPRKNK